ncbi:hypothetical protein F5050DRAFT_1896984 [Lentinula boryana]|uniref:Uncharacterized protein n=1 Tax=Lentinula boryana TaxID=40481 RepID=A0ABQ8Q5S5_9AGAR|nr:hypothetical protein F5050DRAFT_1896984 [Lentinula boryana]
MATVFEPYDTPMLDYHADMDVQMHPNSDPWFHEEANMEAEDTYPALTRSSSDGDLVDVEIEMESYLDEVSRNSEYEMVDEAEAANNAAQAESEDIIVMDASHQPSALQDSVLESLASAELPPQLSASPLIETTTSFTDPQNVVATELEAPSIGTHIHSSESVSEDVVPVNGALESELSGPTIVSEEAILLEPLFAQIPQGGPLAHVEGSVPEEEHVSNTVTNPAVASDDGDSSNIDAAVSFTEENGPVQVEAEDIRHPSLADEEVVVSTEADAGTLDQSEIPDVAGSVEHPVEHTENEEENPIPENDPHEISEGVYIDPPPAVLLSFAFTDHLDVCLFNQPSPSESSSSRTELFVSLSDQPTLYYEPLSALFEALRNDSETSSLADLSQAELILDAYDLEFTISEDNIFARETSLHDLNVLHDGLGFTGPLRLRLQLVNSRFIIRYRTLQEQVMRLSLGDAGEEYNVEELNENSLQEPTEQEHGPENVEEEDYQDQPEEKINENYLQNEDQPENDTGELQTDFTNEADADHDDELAAPEDDQYTQETEDPEIEGGVEVTSLYDAPEEQGQEDPSESNVEEPTEPTFIDGSELYEVTDNAQEPEEISEGHEEGPLNPLRYLTQSEHVSDQQIAQVLGEDEAIQIQEGPPPISEGSRESEIAGDNDNDTSVASGVLSEPHLSETPKDTEFYQGDDLYYDDTADAEWDGSEYEDAIDEDNAIDGDNVADTTLDTEADGEHDSVSAHSSITLSSRHSKRSIHDVDDDEDDNTEGLASVQSSPGAKRVRTE